MNRKIRTAIAACSIAIGAAGAVTVAATPASAQTNVVTYLNGDGSVAGYGATIVRGPGEGTVRGSGTGSTRHPAKKAARKDARQNGVVDGPGCDNPLILC